MNQTKLSFKTSDIFCMGIDNFVFFISFSSKTKTKTKLRLCKTRANGFCFQFKCQSVKPHESTLAWLNIQYIGEIEKQKQFASGFAMKIDALIDT